VNLDAGHAQFLVAQFLLLADPAPWPLPLHQYDPAGASVEAIWETASTCAFNFLNEPTLLSRSITMLAFYFSLSLLAVQLICS